MIVRTRNEKKNILLQKKIKIFTPYQLLGEMPVHLDEQTLEALGAQLFQHIETGNAEELQQMPHLRQLLRHQYTVDKITPLIKCINKYR